VRFGIVAVVKIELFIKEPVSSLLEGVTVRADGDFARFDSRLVRIASVELRDIPSCVYSPAVSMFDRHVLPPVAAVSELTTL